MLTQLHILAFTRTKISLLISASFLSRSPQFLPGVLYFVLGGGGNSARPTRIKLEPHSTATSKSLVMPIERMSKDGPPVPCRRMVSNISRACSNTGRASSGFSENGAMHIKPRIRMSGYSSVMTSIKGPSAPGGHPPFCFSPATLTWINTSMGSERPKLAEALSISSAKRRLSTE